MNNWCPKTQGPYKSMSLENPRKNWKEGAKKNLDYLLQMLNDFYKKWCDKPWCIFEQHSEFDIIFLETFDGAKRIKLHKGGTLSL
jgi:hypothetical protein